MTLYTGHVYEDALINLIENDPTLLFQRYPCTEGFLGQKYFNFSPYLLMAFRGEHDMLATILSLRKVIRALKDNEHMQTLFASQYAEILCGGADFVKIDRDPRTIDFEKLIQHEETYTILFDRQETLTHTLLENPDGIYCFHKQENKINEFHFFYVHKKDKKIQPLDNSCIIDQSAFEEFKASITAMEKNTSRRLSENEHHLIKQTFNIELEHKGLFYEDKGVLYRDNFAPFFNLENAYRKYDRLLVEAKRMIRCLPQEYKYFNLAHKFWREDVGPEQFKISWVWQRFCEEDKPFYPFYHKSFRIFRRGNWFFNWDTNKDEAVLDNGVIKVSGLGLYKDTKYAQGDDMGGHDITDLITIQWLIENAKAKIIEFNPILYKTKLERENVDRTGYSLTNIE